MISLTIRRESMEAKDRMDVPMVMIDEESMSDVVADSEVTKNTMFNSMTFQPGDSLPSMALEVPSRDSLVQTRKDQPS